MVNDLVVRNVADPAAVPAGKPGRPSQSLTLDQALAVLDAAKGERLWPYVAVSMLGGIRTEEACALRWSEVDLVAGTVAVYRSVRRTGETKTEKSRRMFRDSRDRCGSAAGPSAEAGGRPGEGRTAWKEDDLGSCTSRGGPMYASDVRTEFKRITEKAGLGRDWTPRELRHTFVSLCRIPACPSSRSRTRWATPAPGPPRSCTGTSSGQLPVPRPSRWGRCSRARNEQRRPELNR